MILLCVYACSPDKSGVNNTEMINAINNIIKPLYDPSQLSTKPTCPSKFKKDSKRTDKARMDLANKMAYIAQEIFLEDYLYAQSANIDLIEFPDVDAENLETNSESMLHSLDLANF